VESAVFIEGVHKHYGKVQALQGIHLSIAKGEFFGLLGPNGAGKSTLINIIAGLTRANQGTVAVLGYDNVRQYRLARRHLGLVPQELVFDPFFTVREILQIQSGYYGLGRENDSWIDELIVTLMLADKAHTNMRALSGGMKRRVLIAQALVHKPEVVVLDEPTAGVDVELRQSLWDFVRRLHHEGHTIILTTHYLEEAEALCERIAILDKGKIIALDTTRGLLARGVGRTLRVIVTATAPITAVPAQLERLVSHRMDNQLELQLNRESDSVVDVIDVVRACGITIVDLRTEEADLEDVFIELTRERLQ